MRPELLLVLGESQNARRPDEDGVKHGGELPQFDARPSPGVCTACSCGCLIETSHMRMNAAQGQPTKRKRRTGRRL